MAAKSRSVVKRQHEARVDETRAEPKNQVPVIALFIRNDSRFEGRERFYRTLYHIDEVRFDQRSIFRVKL